MHRAKSVDFPTLQIFDDTVMKCMGRALAGEHQGCGGHRGSQVEMHLTSKYCELSFLNTYEYDVMKLAELRSYLLLSNIGF